MSKWNPATFEDALYALTVSQRSNTNPVARLVLEADGDLRCPPPADAPDTDVRVVLDLKGRLLLEARRPRAGWETYRVWDSWGGPGSFVEPVPCGSHLERFFETLGEAPAAVQAWREAPGDPSVTRALATVLEELDIQRTKLMTCPDCAERDRRIRNPE
jgi:hypothetical protein